MVRESDLVRRVARRRWVELLIRPKINPENLFLLLEPGLPPQAWQREAFDYKASGDLLPSVIAFFARTVETTLARGVLRAYQTRQESLVALRGRLDVAGQFTRAGVLTPVACQYDEFSEDILENRVLRAAVRLALRVPGVDQGERRRLMHHLATLEAVADVVVRPQVVDSIHLTRLNQHYGPALRLAQLILKNLTLKDERGSTTTTSFMVDMNTLFQRFVTERLRRELRSRLDVISEPRVHLGTEQQVAMRPDLVFRAPGTAADHYVVDIKYKPTDDASGVSSDYYQLLAYTTAMDLNEGMLIYCRRDGDRDERTVVVRNCEKRLVLRSVDLRGSADQVERELAQLSAEIADRGFRG